MNVTTIQTPIYIQSAGAGGATTNVSITVVALGVVNLIK